MTLKEWFAMQHELDSYIEREHELQGEDLFEKKLLALLVEIGELANETRCFKFWSKKPPAPREDILEEFVDGIHFILSLGLELEFSDREISLVSQEANENLDRSFLKVFRLAGDFRQSKSAKDYEELFRQYMVLGQTLGFQLDEVQEAYKKKNEVNFKRQQEGY
ncbi:dUTP diphosphatase [Siminovitchia sediminis]|uniref:dUTP diphosphatase n=1 Tax=Siminovitchia sediminis TaxID=1274353 RepID=A0ABW4KDU8_9BACI